MTEDERAIRELIDTWMTATAAGETEAVLSLMADDVVFLGPGQPPFGKKEFAAMQRELNAFIIRGQSDVKEVRVSGDWAYAWSHLVVSMTPKEGGAEVRRAGNTLSVFHRLPNSRWVLARDANLLTPETS